MSVEYYLPLYFQSVKEDTPLHSGLHVLPLALSTAITATVTGIVIHRTGRFRELIWLGTFIHCLGSGLFILLGPNTSIATAIGLQIILGIGSGFLFEPPLIALQSRGDQQDVASATSALAFVRSSALALSVIICGVVFQNSMGRQTSHLVAAGVPDSIVKLLSGKEAAANVMVASGVTDPVLKLAIKEAFASSIRNMFITTTAFSSIGIVAGAFVVHGNLSKEHVETVTGIKKEKPDTSAALQELV